MSTKVFVAYAHWPRLGVLDPLQMFGTLQYIYLENSYYPESDYTARNNMAQRYTNLRRYQGGGMAIALIRIQVPNIRTNSFRQEIETRHAFFHESVRVIRQNKESLAYYDARRTLAEALL